MRDIQTLPDDGHLYAAHVINDLWRETDGKAVVVTDVGQHQMWEAQYYKHNEPRSLITSGGLGTMGFALPAAIGAKVACPDAEVWVVAGDGGFQMTMCELATAMQEQLDINVAIINNGYLGHGAAVAGVLLQQALRRHPPSRALTSSSWPKPSAPGAPRSRAGPRSSAPSTRRAASPGPP